MKWHLTFAGIIGLGLTTAAEAQSTNCDQRERIVAKLTSKYDENLTAGGLQNTRATQNVMEIWASSKTGTFTVLVTSPHGVSCVVAAGTDFFKAEETPIEQGSAS